MEEEIKETEEITEWHVEKEQPRGLSQSLYGWRTARPSGTSPGCVCRKSWLTVAGGLVGCWVNLAYEVKASFAGWSVCLKVLEQPEWSGMRLLLLAWLLDIPAMRNV